MGLFGNPKCPRCGGKTVRTNVSFPYPQLRCNRCVRENTQKRKDAEKIADLEQRLKNLEK